MILAAGLGTRMKPYTLRTPKPLIPLLGVPCIDFSVLSLKDAGVNSVVVNVHAHADQMKTFFKNDSSMTGMELIISDESDLLLGSAGGFKKAIAKIESKPGESVPFFSMNADVVSHVDLKKLAEHHFKMREKHGVVMTLCLAKGSTLTEQEGSYTEIIVDEESGLICGLGAKKQQTPFYTGTAVFETACFRHLPEGVPSEFTPEVLIPWIKKNKVAFFWMEDFWADIGSPNLWWKSHFQLLKSFQENRLPKSWMQEIEKQKSSFYLSSSECVVDYDHTHQVTLTGQNYIQYMGERTDV